MKSISKKTKAIIAFSILAILFIVYILADGMEFYILNTICINTKYYDSPTKAFKKVYYEDLSSFETAYEIEGVLLSSEIDQWNTLCVFETENDNIYIIAILKTKNNKYYCSNQIITVDITNRSNRFISSGRLHNGIKFSKLTCYFKIIDDSDLALLNSDEEYTVMEFSENLKLVYYCK